MTGLLLLSAVLTSQAGDVFNVKDYGAVPNDGQDDTKALREAVALCRAHEGSTLVIPAGTYLLRDVDAMQLEADAIGGKMGANPESTIFSPYYPYAKGLDFSGAKGVTIEAEGATLLCDGWMEPVSLTDCTDLTLRGLTIDYVHRALSEGTVAGIGEDYFDVQFRPDRTITDVIPITRVTLADPQIGGMYRSPFYYPKRELLGNNLVRLTVGRRIPDYLLGQPVAALHSMHFRPAILILNSTNTTLDGVTIHSQPGMGIVGFDSRDIFINRLRVAPADGYHFSTNTDATHFACCEGELVFDGCSFIGQGDDATNVHGYYHNVEAADDGWLRLILHAPGYTHAQVADVPRVGDELELSLINTLAVQKVLKVMEVKHEEKATDVLVRVDGPMPEKLEDYYLFNITKLPRLTFRNSLVQGNLARGVLVKTRGVLIEDNVFRGCSGTAIHVGAEGWWCEGSHSTDVTIRRNTMINCGLGAGSQHGANGIAVVIDAPDTKGTRLHDGIVIRDNVVIGNGENGCGICVRNAKNVDVADNRITNCKQEVVMGDVDLAPDTRSYWAFAEDGNGIVFTPGKDNLPYTDHIEMSGEQMAFVLRWGVDDQNSFNAERSLVFPMLRTIPNNTHASLMHRVGTDVPSLLSVNGLSLVNEQVQQVCIDGYVGVKSTFSVGQPNVGGARGNYLTPAIEMTRRIFPSTDKPLMGELYTMRNITQRAQIVYIPDYSQVFTTPADKGVTGSYIVRSDLTGTGTFTIQPGDSLTFGAVFQAYRVGETKVTVDLADEFEARQAFLATMDGSLVLDTPNDVIDREFRFAKIRASESIFKTKGGYMHGPGGESYYAAIWANDQAEYVNPFFPFTGYGTGNASALNSYMHFARFMNDKYEPIPSSIIAEGDDIWNGAGDRGDAAMIAHGALRYVMERGSREEAEQLWPLIEWCLEYCRRQLNEAGVVKSNCDELEGRFPAGEANLCTSTLYYDGLRSAAMLCKELGLGNKRAAEYSRQADALAIAIEKYFGAEVGGFHTYRYYDGNTLLRSWICMPLIVGIENRAEGTIAALTSPKLLTNDGLLTQEGSETFWDRSTLYSLRGIYIAGDVATADRLMNHYSNRRLLGNHVPYPIEAWPEGSQRHLSAESGLYCRSVVEGMFGLRPTGLRSFTVSPRMADGWDTMALRHIRAFESDFDIEVVREGTKMEITVINNATGKRQTKRVASGSTANIAFSLPR